MKWLFYAAVWYGLMGYVVWLSAAYFLGQLPVVAACHMEAAKISCVLIRCHHNMVESW